MSNDWYEQISPESTVTQGDLIFECPLLSWKSKPQDYKTLETIETFRAITEVVSTDVIVMTQACDLEYNKVKNVVLCPHSSITKYKEAWEEALRAKANNPTVRAWNDHFDDICEGFLWNLAVLKSFNSVEINMEQRVVDFHEIFTVPRQFLETLLKDRNNHRLRLLPPYREHLSQAFARFFMRVGLPNPIKGD